MNWRARRSSLVAADEPVGTDPYATSDVRVISTGPAATGADEVSSVDYASLAAGQRAGELSEVFSDMNESKDDRPETVSPRRRPTIPIDVEDELPENVYLDGGLAEKGDPETIFIEDGDRLDTIQPNAAGSATVNSQRRQQWIGISRDQNRRRLIGIVVVTGIAAVIIGGLALLGSSWFAVKNVNVMGQVYADPEMVAEVVSELEGTPVLLVDTDDLERQLESIPWVERARVTASFPDSATVELRERNPVATVQGADRRFRILDREGRVLDVIQGRAVAYVLITGPDPVDLTAGQFVDVGHAAAAALVTKLTPEVRGRLISIDATADGRDMGLLLVGADDVDATIDVRLGEAITDNDQVEKLVRLERVLADADGDGATRIDVATAETTQQ